MEEKHEEPLDWSIDGKPFACPFCGDSTYLALLWECCVVSRAEFEARMVDYVPHEDVLVMPLWAAKLLKEFGWDE